MKNYRLILPLLLMLVLDSQTSFAQLEEKMRHHVIIAIDEVMNNIDGRCWPQDSKVYNIVESYLTKTQVDNDVILRQGDLLSIVGFGTTKFQTSMDNYIFPLRYCNNGERAIYLENDGSLLRKIKQCWWHIADRQQNPHIGPDKYSMITLAKPYAIVALMNKNYKQHVNRTFIIVITDDKYNGGTVYEEASSLPNITADELLKEVVKVQNEYFIYRYGRERVDVGNNRFVDLYEYQPHQEHLTLSSMWNYKPTYEFKRGEFGKYTLNVADAVNPNDHHKIVKLEYALLDKDGNVLGEPKVETANIVDSQYDPIAQFEWEYTDAFTQKAQNLRIRAWATLEDGVYNSTILTPSELAPKFLGKKGLCVTVPLTYEKTEKIWGVIPIPNFLMFLDNQQKMLWILNIVAGAIILGLLIGLFRSLQTYRPKESEVKIRKV